MTRRFRSEADLVAALLARIRDDHGGWARKVHGSQFTGSGEPDIDACINGRAIKAEAKQPGQTPTASQYGSMKRWQRAGALVGWVTSLDELDALLEHLGDAGWQNPQLVSGERIALAGADERDD